MTRFARISRALVAAIVITVPAAPALGADDAPDPWTEVSRVRAGLIDASPIEADFVQSFTPSGFSVADEESGRLAMRLVDDPTAASECVRWDYEEPFPKGFLLCDRIAWAWNPGETTGRRQVIARADEFGLDLLRLSVDDLRRSYRAAVVDAGGETIEIRLEPTAPGAAAEIRDATLRIDPASLRLLSIAYHDVEGNLTRFALGDYRRIDDPEAVFSPPPGLDWLDE